MNSEIILSRLVQIGTVTDVDSARRKARVKFKETGITSDWLNIIKSNSTVIFSDPESNVTVIPWTPKVNDTVLVLYFPVFNGDGFILGGI